MDKDQQRIAELQDQVVEFRRLVPKTYRKLLKSDYKHFISNLRHGKCTIPAELLDIPMDGADALGKQLQEIAEVRTVNETGGPQRTSIEELVERETSQLITARQMLSRMRRRSTSDTANAVN